MASGSPPDSTARRASSATGGGGHHTSSFTSLQLRLRTESLDSEVSPRRREGFGNSGPIRLGDRGTRNLRHDLSSFAVLGSIDATCCGVPRRESKSEAVDLGDGGFVEDERDLIKSEDGECEYDE